MSSYGLPVATVVMRPNNPLLAAQLEGLAEEMRSQGHEVSIERELRESRTAEVLAVATLALKLRR